MLRAFLAMCLFAVFLCVGQVILFSVMWMIASVGLTDCTLVIWSLGFILLLPAAFFLAGHVVLSLFGPIPTCKPHPSSSVASE
jgi:hypothetical protein